MIGGQPVSVSIGYSGTEALAASIEVTKVFVNQLDYRVSNASVHPYVWVQLPVFDIHALQPLVLTLGRSTVFLEVSGIPGVYHVPEICQVCGQRTDDGHLYVKPVIVAGVSFDGGKSAASTKSP